MDVIHEKNYVSSLIFSSLLTSFIASASSAPSYIEDRQIIKSATESLYSFTLGKKKMVASSSNFKSLTFSDYRDATDKYIAIYQHLLSESYTLVNECLFEKCGNSIELANNIDSVHFISDKNKQRVATFSINNNLQIIHLSSYEDKSYVFIRKINNIKESFSQENSNQISDVYFDLNSYEIAKSYYKNLNYLVESSNDKTNIVITGHSDNSGNYDLNMQLSLNRAKAVAEYLIHNGFNSSNIKVEAMGSLLPITSDNSKNRRVEISFNL
ncbi:OmpA family protein [Pseudoalteromonas espejiana]